MSSIHLAVALDGAGWHPTAWREPDARPDELLTAGYWVDLVTEAERATLDFITIEDSLAPQSDNPFRPDRRTDRVRGRLDAVMTAARVAPRTRGIGFIPTAVVTHTEPFHISKAIATLDYVSRGRAGVRVQVVARPDVAKHFGRRDFSTPPDTTDLFDEAADYVEVLRRLWDSWEDDAEIRDVATGRFIDREKLHYIDFEGRWFSVKGPSITPRPPQGQPVVAALGHSEIPYQFIARNTDVGFITPQHPSEARSLVDAIAADRTGEPVRVFADVVVFLGDSDASAQARKSRLDEQLGREFQSDAKVFVGTPAELADLLTEWQSTGLTGFRLRPATIPHDLLQITDGLVPELRRRGLFRETYEADTLRGLLGLPRPANRYAAL
ncbi:LLM class flavin-dependent oxidoreductase [Mycolicibacterium phlei]